MTDNFDSSVVGRPFVRVRDLRISYPEPNTAIIVCTQEEAVLLEDGSVRSLGDAGYLQFRIAPSQMTDVVNLVNPTTGLQLPGNPSMSYQQIMLGLLAAIRHHQVSAND